MRENMKGRLILPETLDIPMALRVKQFIKDEETEGRYFWQGKAQYASQLHRFAVSERDRSFAVNDANYDLLTEAVSNLMNGDPEPNTWQGELLTQLANAIHAYEERFERPL